jgi:hypothetical protein
VPLSIFGAGTAPATCRAGPPLMVGDLSEAEALQLLAINGAPDEIDARRVVLELTGGSLPLLERAAALLRARHTVPDVEKNLMRLMEASYVKAGLMDASPQQSSGLAAIAALLRQASGRRGLSAAEWRGAVPDREQQRALLDTGVLGFDGERAGFASRLSEAFADRRLRAALPPNTREVLPHAGAADVSAYWKKK